MIESNDDSEITEFCLKILDSITQINFFAHFILLNPCNKFQILLKCENDQFLLLTLKILSNLSSHSDNYTEVKLLK